MHFANACASLCFDRELVHLEDLFLHDASHDIRTPTHELTIAATYSGPAGGFHGNRPAGGQRGACAASAGRGGL
ncbi:hypothetical protein CDO30_22360 (plasmid) [Sinorhizobium meliloti]|nr:hypothetical protein [Sinorhizobium meliloti]AGG70912.1 hypothetical protein SM2011_a6535 [Sinorhizobium meliloti 2011]ASP60976.1 hypothetical protein CDO30_22360 [Sinorhizobium meliloti]TWA94077.1 hypothetical protein FB000_12340 [Ensifer sp. SEMIA 134]TWB30312.1 hypothetical protein FB001_12075 [Ensifer sp. SEMIA 135]